jgi:hypothetical protein
MSQNSISKNVDLNTLQIIQHIHDHEQNYWRSDEVLFLGIY